jgi:hypothetical protein
MEPFNSPLEKDVKFKKIQGSHFGSDAPGKYVISPYQDYIPLAYVTRVLSYNGKSEFHTLPFTWSSDHLWKLLDKKLTGDEVSKEVERLMKNDIIWPFASHFRLKESKEENIKQILTELSNYMTDDTPLSFEEMMTLGGAARVSSQINYFFDPVNSQANATGRLRFRRLKGMLGPYTLVIEDEKSEPVPYIVAVVRREDYVYQRLHYLIHNTLDPRRVIIFVDKSFQRRVLGISPIVKRFYTRFLKPVIDAAPCPAFYVSHEFLEEHCTTREFTAETSIIKRGKQTKALLVEALGDPEKGVDLPGSIPQPRGRRRSALMPDVATTSTVISVDPALSETAATWTWTAPLVSTDTPVTTADGSPYVAFSDAIEAMGVSEIRRAERELRQEDLPNPRDTW